MIEFRWLVSPRNDAERVLQFRRLYCAGWDEHGVPHFDGRWEEWENVPEITADLPQQSPMTKE